MPGGQIVQLPQATSRTITGPRLGLIPPRLVLEYDCEQDDGSTIWTRISFSDVLAVDFRQEACCTAEDVEGYNRMVRYQDSDWLAEIRDRWRRYLGRQGERRAPAPMPPGGSTSMMRVRHRGSAISRDRMSFCPARQLHGAAKRRARLRDKSRVGMRAPGRR